MKDAAPNRHESPDARHSQPVEQRRVSVPARRPHRYHCRNAWCSNRDSDVFYPCTLATPVIVRPGRRSGAREATCGRIRNYRISASA